MDVCDIVEIRNIISWHIQEQERGKLSPQSMIKGKAKVNSTTYFRAVNPPFLAGRLSVLEAVSLSLYFKRNLPVFENNQFLNIKVYENDMRKNSLFSFTNFLGSA